MDDPVTVTASQSTISGKVNEANRGSHTDYTAFVLVPVFFLLGLLGVIICHVLKRKGYRCTTTEAPDEDEAEHTCEDEEKDPELGGEFNDTLSDNNDTVGQIVHFIMKNEANSDALKAMIHDNSIDSDGAPVTPTSPFTPSPPTTPISPGAPPAAAKHTCNHLHTIGGLGGHKNICTRCSQKKWPLMSKPAARKAEPRRSHGEVTVLSVGRFRVTKCEKPTRERRIMFTADSNGSVPSEDAVSNTRTVSESQEVGGESQLGQGEMRKNPASSKRRRFLSLPTQTSTHKSNIKCARTPSRPHASFPNGTRDVQSHKPLIYQLRRRTQVFLSHFNIHTSKGRKQTCVPTSTRFNKTRSIGTRSRTETGSKDTIMSWPQLVGIIEASYRAPARNISSFANV